MENMRTLAFQVPEELFQRIKDYLQRNNVSQKQFVIGLIEAELNREQTELEGLADGKEDTFTEENMEEMNEEGIAEEFDNNESEENAYDGNIEDDEEYFDEDESQGLTMGM